MKTSQQLDQIFSALANAAAEFPKIERGCTAKVYPKKEGAQPYSYDYADLDDVLSAVRGPLAKNGVILSHDAKLIRDPLCLEVTARLEHASGQFKESEPLPMPLEGTMSLAQQIGSAYTYGRRYTSQAILGISTEADDDGHGAGDQQADTGRKKSEPKPPCPECGSNESVIVGKPEYGGGFVCFAKKGGCGHKWHVAPTDEPPPEQPKAEAKKTNGHTDVPNHPSIKTGAQLEAEQASFDAWADMLVKSTPATHDATLKTLKRAISDGRLTSDFTFKIICRALERAEKPEHLDGIEKLMKPLIDAAKIPERDSLKFAELLPAAEDRIGVTVGA